MWFYYSGYRFSHLSYEAIEQFGLSAGPKEPWYAIFLARLRRDGFASLHAGEEPGVVLTRPLRVTGSQLYLNVEAAAGQVRVELRDAVTGRGLAGYSMGDYLGSRILRSDDGQRGGLRIGPGARFEDDPEQDDTVPVSTDSTAVPVSWKGGNDLSALNGREVRLFFHLRDAHLYSFWFAE